MAFTDMTYPLLKLARTAPDLADEKTREYFNRITVVETENLTREVLEEWGRVVAMIAAELREQIDDPKMRDACLQALYSAAAQLPEDDALVAAYFAGAEQGARHGSERAERMIDESRQFAEILRGQMPWLEDDAVSDE